MGLFSLPRQAADRAYNRFSRSRDPRLVRAAKIRNGSRWRRVAKAYKAAHPLCEDPFGRHQGGIPAVTEDVHHIRGLIDAPELAYHRANLMALCRDCHSAIEAQVRTGNGEGKGGRGDRVGSEGKGIDPGLYSDSDQLAAAWESTLTEAERLRVEVISEQEQAAILEGQTGQVEGRGNGRFGDTLEG